MSETDAGSSNGTAEKQADAVEVESPSPSKVSLSEESKKSPSKDPPSKGDKSKNRSSSSSTSDSEDVATSKGKKASGSVGKSSGRSSGAKPGKVGSKFSSSSKHALEAGVIALTQLTGDVKKRVENMDTVIIPEIRSQLKNINEVNSGFKKTMDSILGAVKNIPKPQVPGKLVLEDCTEMEKSEAARRLTKREKNQTMLEHVWSDIVEQDAYLARTHLSMVHEEMEKKLSTDGRRAEAEILIQEMLDKFRAKLEEEYADKLKEAKIKLKEEADATAWERLFAELEKRQRELLEIKERELAEEKVNLLEKFRLDFEAYKTRTQALQERLIELLRERNNLAKDFMALQADYKRFIDVEKGPDQWQYSMEMRDYQIRGTEEYTDKWTPLVMPETFLVPPPSEEDRGKVERDPALSPRDSRDVTGTPQVDASPPLPENLTSVPSQPTGLNANENFYGKTKISSDEKFSGDSYLQPPNQFGRRAGRQSQRAKR